MNDNSTPFPAKAYEAEIHKTMPFYDAFHASALDLVRTVIPAPQVWLDTGCGTGGFARRAAKEFGQTKLYLADPSEKMIEQAKQISGAVIQKSTAELAFPEQSFDVITAILSHHYLSREERRKSTENCFRMLKPNGLYITFENIRPDSPAGIEIAMKRWLSYKLAHGEANEQDHYKRLGSAYFPITVSEHLDLLRKTGFKTAEILWLSCMQAGFYGLK